MPTPAAVIQELERMAGSNSFRKADRCLRLLRHVTTMALAGRGGELKEYTLGVTVFDRPASYDPRIDPIVRLEARRLRLKLAEYYQQEGREDPIVVDLPKGAYVPDFRVSHPPDEPKTSPVAAPRHFPAWRVGIVAVFLALASWYFYTHRPVAAIPLRASIAVLGFEDLSPQNDRSWVAAAIAELMNIELGAGQQFRILPLENVAHMRKDLALGPGAGYSARVLQRIRANLGVDYLVAGSYRWQGERIHLDTTLMDARSGRPLAAISEETVAADLAQLSRRCAERIRTQLGVRISGGGTGRLLLEAAAMEPYARGMEQLRQSDALNARGNFERAVAAAPANPLVHSGLAAAWTTLGLDKRALPEARLAYDSSQALGRVEQLEIEGRYRSIAQEWPRAIQVYQALFTLLPDDLEYGLLLASAEAHGGRAREALDTVKALRSLPAPLGDDPRIDLAEAQAAGALSDFARTRAGARRAAEKASARGSRLQYARARLLESGAMQDLAIAGYAEVRAEARGICAELGDRACVAAAYRIEANERSVKGSLETARGLYQKSLEIADEMGNSLERLNCLTGLAYVAKLQGDLRAAETSDRAALAVGAEMGPQKTYPVSIDLADVLAGQGRLAESRLLLQDARKVSEQVGERVGIGLSEASWAHTLVLDGNLSEAIGKYSEALQVLREVNDPQYIVETLLALGDAQLQAGDTQAARKNFEAARSLAQPFAGAFDSPEIEMAFARLGLGEEHWKEAAKHARAALGAFSAAGRQGDRYEALAVLARALIQQGQAADAFQAMGQIPPPEGRGFPISASIQFRIARCLVLANTGRRAEAARTMELMSAEVERLELPLLRKDLRLAKEALANTARNY